MVTSHRGPRCATWRSPPRSAASTRSTWPITCSSVRVRQDRGHPRGLDRPVGGGGAHQPGGDRSARARGPVPQPGAHRQDGRRARRGQRRTAGARARLRLARAGVRGIRLPVRPSRRSLRGSARDHPPAASRGTCPLRRTLAPGERRAAAARSAPGQHADPDRGQGSADAAARRPSRRPLERGVVRPTARGAASSTRGSPAYGPPATRKAATSQR